MAWPAPGWRLARRVYRDSSLWHRDSWRSAYGYRWGPLGARCAKDRSTRCQGNAAGPQEVQSEQGETRVSKLLLIPLVALAWLGFAQETTIQVPQGSGVLPTIGQVNCLEELGSGRLCAATYDCSGESGRLWGDLANHNGRRAIGKDSPVARGRDCVITVDGRAAVRWLTAYSPGGRTGELVGLTTSEDALRPVQRVERQTGEGGGRLIDYILERYDTTLAEYVEEQCRHIDQGHHQHNLCVDDLLTPIVELMDLPENPFTRCMVELLERVNRDGGEPEVLALSRNVGFYRLRYRTEGIVDGEYVRGRSREEREETRCLSLAEETLTSYGVERYVEDRIGRALWGLRE